jgi:tetratricopeptide (TPR) repeat protein
MRFAMLTRNTLRLLLVVLAVGAPLGLVLLWRPAPPAAAGAPIPVRPEAEPYNPLKYVLSTEQVVQLFQERVQRDPADFLSYASLGHTYLRLARESGDLTAYDRADAAFRRVLELRPGDFSGLAGKALVLNAQHQFAAGLRLSQQLYRDNPEAHELLYAIGDAQLELGNYREAEEAYRELGTKVPGTLLYSRQARLKELRGNTQEALRLMEQAAREELEASITRREGAWYEFRLGEMHFNAGHLEEAGHRLQASLAINPRYPLALAYLAKVRAAQGKDDDALDLYRRAVGAGANLSVLADRGDLAARTGNDFLAQLNYDQLEKTAAGKAVYDRELALFDADHDRNLPRAVELAERDLTVRQDVYAHDTLAWALCKNKRFAEAAKELAEALKLGTQDASLFYHAGMIQYGLGDKKQARSYLERALALNPHFSQRQATVARQTLAELGGADARPGRN